MRKWLTIMQVCFTYVGTVVGAGFATGQEILQFFTKYGWMATATIGLSSLLFIWIGTKLMSLAQEIQAQSYEDLNRLLFGERAGVWVSRFTFVIMFGVTTVMLAGGGSVFAEQLHLSYQTGLLITLFLAYIVLSKGISAIVAVNSFVVPLMVLFSCAAVIFTWDTPGSNNWLVRTTDDSAFRVWAAPLLYSAFNLSMAQAVLVPLGSMIKDKSILRLGGLLGGLVIGLMLLAGHFALSAQMPGISQFEIPMAHIFYKAAPFLQIMFLLVIYGEIFTTYIANAFGLCLQVEQRLSVPRQLIIITVLTLSYLVSQIGFKTLLTTLYPLFGLISLVWLALVMGRRSAATANKG